MRALLVLAIVCACDGGGARRRPSTQERPRIEQARRADVFDRVLVTGTLQARSSAELRVPRTNVWELSIRWMAEDGSAVKAGQRVLEFDTSAFTNQLAERRLQYLDAVLAFRSFHDVSALEIGQKEFELATNKIVLAKATLLASVPADLLPARTAQERQLERKRAEAASAKSEKDLAVARAAATLDKQVKQIELDKVKATIEDAERAIDELVLKAPRDGVIVIGDHPWMGRKLQVADMTQPGWTVVSLPDFGSGMEVRAELSDVDDGRVAVGMTGACTLDAYPSDPRPCTVTTLMPVASAKGGQSLRRGFALVLSLDNVDAGRSGPEAGPPGSVTRGRMLPGMSVKVELKRPPLANQLVVPRGAVVFTKTTTRVQLASGQLRDVELGPCDAQVCVVTKGLAAGEGVAVGGGT